ncbi:MULTISPECIES: acVLRF1 family peptidyl-tRNA hydrolase [Actinoalloteichus]|uniref:Actinobacteria/chloroflexi VLRF1 release factor domain-containing protein n=1 Tax=Actinoalloteichus fjordicus TaxID=1612552 RepID=A0AAC9LDA8_9PSEU|nr:MULTISPECIES: acVLRF1 family peptidyl-tRNA hydrolase [Actinoalloteichus]APU14582.1 hypothetical protein UA74_12610 [Actinoalloteichus fjordicus]APU20550.1 hypothetical protein UA75_12690 [Actinoalloteichus sp. GBA129-24]
MSRVRSVAGGGRAVEVEPARLAGWFERFAGRHGGLAATETTAGEVRVIASDGARASVVVPFGGLTDGRSAGLGAGEGGSPDRAVEVLVEHVLRSRRIGLVLVRLGGYSVGVAVDGRVTVSRTGRRQVHGRNKAGGWSQQRFARRRAGQARVSLSAAGEATFEVLLPEAPTLDAVVLGGDRTALDEVRADPRLAPLFAIAEPRVLDVVEPRRVVLDEAARRALAVEVVVVERSDRTSDGA